MKMDSNDEEQEETCCDHHVNPTFSQCAALQNVSESIRTSCLQMEDDSILAFESVLEGNDVASLQQLEETNDNLAISLADSSFHSDDGEDSNLPASRPHVPFSVEEVSLVKSLACWANCNVRVVGNVTPPSHPESNIWSLRSIGEEGGPFSIAVDMKLLAQCPQANAQVQIFGEVQLVNHSYPVILAKLFRDFSAVDIYHYHKMTEELKKFVPHFINSKPTQQSRRNDERMNME